MRISLVAAVASNGVIGVDNRLPWRLPADLRRFKRITMGHPVLMGRKTHESIGRALPGRTNIVLTRDPDYRADGCVVAHGVDEALALCPEAGELMVIGGASVYAQLLARADRLYLTRIHEPFDGDQRFPAFDAARWREIAREDCVPDERNPHAYSFVVLERGQGTLK